MNGVKVKAESCEYPDTVLDLKKNADEKNITTAKIIVFDPTFILKDLKSFYVSFVIKFIET